MMAPPWSRPLTGRLAPHAPRVHQMKIICDSCGAKYSIADEKIAGKVFKIRCKKCSHVLVVRGDQAAAPAAESAAQAAAGTSSVEAIWHVVVGGDQQGPYTPEQVGQMMAAGQIDWEAYVWREGFEGWLPAREVPELVEAISGGSAAATQAPTAATAEPDAASAGLGADPFATSGSLGADPFTEDDESTKVADSSAFSSASAPAVQPAPAQDLFAQAQAADPTSGSAFDAPSEDVVASSPGPRVSAEQALTGQRNENSVLFSLSNLQALATGGSENASSPMGSPASEGASPKPGYAGGEGSGLIDIRALANAAASTNDAKKEEDIEALLSIGGAPVGPGLAAPVLAPPVEAEKDDKKKIYLIAGGAAAAAALLVVVLVLVLGGKDEPAPGPQMAAATGGSGAATQQAAPPSGAANAPAAQPAAAQAAQAAQPAAAQAAQAAQPAAAQAKTGSAEPPPTGSAERPEAPPTSSRRRRSTRRRSTGQRQSAAASAPSRSAPAPSPRRRGGNDIDSLLEQAIGGSGGNRRTRSSGGGGGSGGSRSNANLPAQPSRSQVLAAMGRVKGSVSRCAQGGEKGRTVTAAITVRGSTGRVSAVNVSGSVSPATRSCVARAVRKASFPKFKRNTFKINFPFRL